MRKSGRLFIQMAVALAAAGSIHTAVAADAVPESIRACAQVKDATTRLRCFDRAVMELGVPVAAGAGSTPSAAASVAVAAPALTPEESFGAKGTLKVQQQHKAEEPPPLKQLTSNIKAVRTGPSGEYIVTLENGQVWRQLSAQPMQMRVGQPVTLKPMSMGSFWMADVSGRGSRVKRLQ
jgi:hypothetical protein